MAIVLYQRGSVPDCLASVPRTTQKSLNLSQYEEEQVTRYKNPHSKPEPSSQHQGQSLTERSGSSECAAVKDLEWAVAHVEDKETCFIENSTLQQFKVIQGHRSWCQSKAHM